jgi:hypothetical protein
MAVLFLAFFQTSKGRRKSGVPHLITFAKANINHTHFIPPVRGGNPVYQLAGWA